MPNITVSPTSYDIRGDIVTVRFTSNTELTKVELTKDDANYLNSTNFTQTEATFNISSWPNDTFSTCKLRGTYPLALVSSITLNKKTHLFDEKTTFKLIPTILPSNAGNKNVVWDSSNKSVATVDNTGLVTALANGETTITCTAEDAGKKKDTCVVTVRLAIKVTSVSLNKKSHTFTSLNDTTNLIATISPSNATNTNITWSSDNTSVATVSNGTVTSKKDGTANIKVTTQDGNKVGTCVVTVDETPRFSLSPTTYTITGDTLTVNFTCNKTITGIKMNTDNSDSSFPYAATSFTQTSATFNLASVGNGTYTIKLQASY